MNNDHENSQNKQVVLAYLTTCESPDKQEIIVPENAVAYLYVDDVFIGKKESSFLLSDALSISQLNKLINVYISYPNEFKKILWGFGNVQIINKTLNEAFRLGCNGECCVDIFNYPTLFKMVGKEEITMRDIQKIILPLIEKVGKDVCTKLFINNTISAKNANLLRDKIEDAFYQRIVNSKLLVDFGLSITLIQLMVVYVNNDDLEYITIANEHKRKKSFNYLFSIGILAVVVVIGIIIWPNKLDQTTSSSSSSSSTSSIHTSSSSITQPFVKLEYDLPSMSQTKEHTKPVEFRVSVNEENYNRDVGWYVNGIRQETLHASMPFTFTPPYNVDGTYEIDARLFDTLFDRTWITVADQFILPMSTYNYDTNKKHQEYVQLSAYYIQQVNNNTFSFNVQYSNSADYFATIFDPPAGENYKYSCDLQKRTNGLVIFYLHAEELLRSEKGPSISFVTANQKSVFYIGMSVVDFNKFKEHYSIVKEES